MRRKGFTLIELIVVIAIIGTLAAILVPAMLGYIRKAKIQSANNSASQVIKTMNAIFTEESEWDGFSNVDDGLYGMNTPVGDALNNIVSDSGKHFTDYVSEYDDDVASMTFVVYVKGGVAVASAAQSGKYFGTFPVYINNSNYEKELGSVPSMSTAISAAVKEYNKGIGIDS